MELNKEDLLEEILELIEEAEELAYVTDADEEIVEKLAYIKDRVSLLLEEI